VIVEDDGIGFAPEGDPEAAPSRPRLGLSGIRERLALLRGSLSLESRPGAGTTLFVQIPIPPQEPREAA
jgi:signal transduction histidine kinase